MDYINMSHSVPPFRVRTFGCIKDSPRHVSPGSKQGDVMLILNVSGFGYHRNSEGETRIEPSMVGFIPFEDCGVHFSDRDDPYFHYYCRFSGDYAIELAHQIIFERGGTFFHYGSIERLVSCMDQLPYVIRKDLPEQMGEYELALARVLVTLLRKQPERKPVGITDDALRQYIELHLESLINLDDMALHFGITKPALCRVTKRLLGTTVVKASNAIRVEYAAELLRDRSMPVAEVAQRVGFDDPFYFSRVFKAQMGVSPKKWQLGKYE